jgi:hypothetical protein
MTKEYLFPRKASADSIQHSFAASSLSLPNKKRIDHVWSVYIDTSYADSVEYTLPERVAGTYADWDILQRASFGFDIVCLW